MKKQFSRILAVVFVLVLCMTMAVPTLAEGTNYSSTIEGAKTTTFDKYLVMDEGANVPNVEFAYAITAGEHVDYDLNGSKFEVLAGVDADMITITWDQANATTPSTVKFTSSDTTTLYADKPETDYVKDLEDGEKYAKHTAIVDFTNVVFPEPGVYRYIITETDPTLPGIVCDADLTRVLDVYVIDASTDTEKKLKIESYVLHANANDIVFTSEDDNFGTDGNTGSGATSGGPDGTAASDFKSQGFTNVFVSHDLTFSKEVTGNQASRDKYFKFTVTITGALPNTVYTVSLADDGNPNTTDGNADATVGSNAATIYENVTNPTSITTDANGSVTQDFYLQHGQSITIRGLGDTTKWTIVEASEDYKPAVEVSGDDDASGDGATASDTDTGIEGDTVAAYTNTRNGVIPTGVLLTIAPFAALMVVGIVGVCFVVFKRKRNAQ